MIEQNRRSIVKTVTWRVVGSTSTFLIAFIITGHPVVSSGIAITQIIVNTLLYWVHERTWARISWGIATK